MLGRDIKELLTGTQVLAHFRLRVSPDKGEISLAKVKGGDAICAALGEILRN